METSALVNFLMNIILLQILQILQILSLLINSPEEVTFFFNKYDSKVLLLFDIFEGKLVPIFVKYSR